MRFSAVFGTIGLRHDKHKDAFLAAPSATDVFKKVKPAQSVTEQDVPLIKQAQVLALCLNPPKPKDAVVSTEPVAPVIITPKFKLLGTSFYPDDPNRSIALIDEPGKGMHWIAVSEKVGHLTITQIADGRVVYTDGQKSMEMMVEKPQGVQQISVVAIDGQSPILIVEKPPVEPAVVVPVQPETVPVESPPQAEAVEESMPTPEQIQDNVEFVKKLMADQNSLGGNAAEANELKDLGEFLKQLEQEQSQKDSNTAASPNSEEEK